MRCLWYRREEATLRESVAFGNLGGQAGRYKYASVSRYVSTRERDGRERARCGKDWECDRASKDRREAAKRQAWPGNWMLYLLFWVFLAIGCSK